MTPPRHILALAVLTGALMLGLAAPLGAQQQRLTLDEGRLLAAQLYQQGEYRAVREIALALLEADSHDVAVQLLLARAEHGLGRSDVAMDIARLAWRISEDEQQRFSSAITIAKILSDQNRLTRAQIWLRRGANHAPDARAEALIRQSYQQIARRNPLTINLGFGLVPSNNVNSGTSNEVVTFAHLPGPFSEIPWLVPPGDRPLSGLEVSARADLGYRLQETPTSRTQLDFGLYARTYVMSRESREIAPEITGESLSYGQAYLGLTHRWLPDVSEQPIFTRLRLAGEFDTDGLVSRSLSLEGGTEWVLGETDRLALGASLTRLDYNSVDAQATQVSVYGQWAHILPNEDQLSVSANLLRSQSDWINLDYDKATLGLAYDFGEILPQVDLRAGIERSWTSYDAVTLDPSGREDVTTAVHLSAGFAAVEFYGFEPVVTMRAQRTESSVPSYDSEVVRLGLELRSQF